MNVSNTIYFSFVSLYISKISSRTSTCGIASTNLLTPLIFSGWKFGPHNLILSIFNLLKAIFSKCSKNWWSSWTEIESASSSWHFVKKKQFFNSLIFSRWSYYTSGIYGIWSINMNYQSPIDFGLYFEKKFCKNKTEA